MSEKKLESGIYWCRISDWYVGQQGGKLFLQINFDVLGTVKDELRPSKGIDALEGEHRGQIRRYFTEKALPWLIEDVETLGFAFTDSPEDLARLSPDHEDPIDLELIEFPAYLYYRQQQYREWRIYRPEKQQAKENRKAKKDSPPVTKVSAKDIAGALAGNVSVAVTSPEEKLPF